jgi:hypothetical protein
LGQCLAAGKRIRWSVSTNLRILKASRKKLQAGDVFIMQLADGRYLFGRVVFVDIPRDRAPMPGSNLIYIYGRPSSSADPDYESLTPENLLLPPIFTNRLAWSKGYFQTIANRPLMPGDILKQHCFRRWTGDYLDELGRILATPTEPCGDWGLSSYRMIDDHISDAIGIERSLDD